MTTLPDTLTDEELVKMAKTGDRHSFEELVRRYQDHVYTLACRTLNDSVRAQDVAQEALVRAWRALSGFQEKSKFSSWLYRITYNCCFTDLRRRGIPADSLSNQENEWRDSALTHSSHFAGDLEKQDLIQQCLQTLTPASRYMVTLYYLQGYDCQEIAQITGRPVGTVKAYLHRSRAQLRIAADRLLATPSPKSQSKAS